MGEEFKNPGYVPPEDTKFWITVNLESSHHLISNTEKHDTKELAVAMAKRLVRKYPNNEYFVLEAVQVIRKSTPPIDVVDLK